MKLFPNFRSITFDYLLISWVTNYGFIDDIDIELLSRKSLELKFGLSSEFSEVFDNIPIRALLDVLFRVFRFSEVSFHVF